MYEKINNLDKNTRERLAEELEYEFEQSLKTQPKLAVDMLESIGVKCIAETR